MPGLRKKPTMTDLDLARSMEAGFSLSRSYSLADTGSFSRDGFTVGPAGITQLPLSKGQMSWSWCTRG